MKTLFEHIEHIKTKPHHVRKRFVFGLAGGISGLVGLIWLGTSLAMGSFAIQGSNFAESTGAAAVEQVPNDASQLAGAAAAGEMGGPARIQIVTVSTSSPAGAPTEETVIPF